MVINSNKYCEYLRLLMQYNSHNLCEKVHDIQNFSGPQLFSLIIEIIMTPLNDYSKSARETDFKSPTFFRRQSLHLFRIDSSLMGYEGYDKGKL